MPEYLNLIREVSKIEAESGQELEPPCTPEQIALVQQEAMAELGVQVPQEYLDFLRLHDGFFWNGLQIFGAEKYESSPARIMGMVEVNLIQREVPGWAHQHLCLADTGDDSYGLRLADNRFCGVDMVSGYVFEEYESFDQMISSVLRELLDR